MAGYIDGTDIGQYFFNQMLPGSLSQQAGLGSMGLGTYGSGVDSVKKGSAKFSARRWLMDYGGGYTYNSFGVQGTPAAPNNGLTPGYPANPGDGPIMGLPQMAGPNAVTNVGNGDSGLSSLSMF
jgi:hypothetical protein